MVVQLIHFWPTEFFHKSEQNNLDQFVITAHLPIVSENRCLYIQPFHLYTKQRVYVACMAVLSELVMDSLCLVCVGRGMCIHTNHRLFYCVFPEPGPEILTQNFPSLVALK